MEFDTKIKVILREGLAPWQELNVTAFLISGIAGTQHIVGDAYVDADGKQYLPMSQQPIVILSAGPEKLSEVMHKATEKGMAVSIYTEELFSTYNDADNRAEIMKRRTSELHLAGVAIRGARNPLDRITKGIVMHK